MLSLAILILVGNICLAQEMPAANDPQAQTSSVDLLDLKDIDILDVLKLISKKTGFNIAASKEVKGRVTVYLKDMDIEEALHIIMEANGWAYVRERDIFKVMTNQEFENRYGFKFGQRLETRIHHLAYVNPSDVASVLNQVKGNSAKIVVDDKSQTMILVDEPHKLDQLEMIIKKIDVPIETKVFKLSYADSEAVSNRISEILTSGLGTLKFDKRLNTIIVSDTARKMQEIERLVQTFDKKDREVLIEAKIVQIVLNREHAMGVDWEAIVSNYHSLNLMGDFDVLSTASKKGKVAIGTIAGDEYAVLIEALDTIGDTEILSNPRITAVNNHEAKILVGSTEPYVTSTVTTPSAGPTTTAEAVNFIEVGVKLFVTPTIHDDDFITMKIKPEVSSVIRTIATGTNNEIPVIETSEAETTVMVKDQVTIVIGGLIKEENIKTVKKVPLLGSIPLLKYAFQNESSQVSKTEIVIFLTPRIISGDIAVQN